MEEGDQLKFSGGAVEDQVMDCAGSCGGSTDLAAVYEATMARRTRDQERLEGAQATRLIDAAAAPAPTVLPPDATFSIRA